MSIESYKFNDRDVSDVATRTYTTRSEAIEINFCGGNCLHLFKQDVIALAKHFNLTSADIE